MKVKAEIELTVQMGQGCLMGTGCVGYLPPGTRYEDIIRIFGQPQLGASPDQKIKCEWYGKVNGLIFTIYDYKSKLDPERNTDWHIGGKSEFTAELVNLYFRAQ